MQRLILGKDLNGDTTYSIYTPSSSKTPASDPDLSNFIGFISAGTEIELTIPDGAELYIIGATPGATIYSGQTEAGVPLVTPVADSFVKTTGGLQQIIRSLNDLTRFPTLRVNNLSADAAYVNVEFFRS